MPHTIAGKTVGDIAYGTMSLYTPRAVPLTDEQRIAAVKAAIDSGCTFLDASDFYGDQHGDNTLTLLRKYFDAYPEDASKVVVNVKGAYNNYQPAGTKEEVAKSIDRCIEQLGPRVRIDEFEPARRDPNVDYVEDTLATIDSYVQAGKVGAIAVSELGPDTLQKALERFPISSLEIELSLFRTDPLTNGLLELCAKNNVKVIAYSPLGKGFLTGDIKSPEDIPEGDFRRMYPRMQGDNFQANFALVSEVVALAQKKGCTPGQIAISWLVSLGKRPGMPTIIPVPGSASPDRIRENAKIVDLSGEDMKEIDTILTSFTAVGDRYPKFFMDHLDL